MAEKIQLKLVTPLKEVHAGEADMVLLPAFAGEMGVLPGHELYMTLLNTGFLVAEDGSDKSYFFVNEGYAEIKDDVVRVLAEVCEPADGIDLERAIEAQKRAEEHLSGSDTTADTVRAQAALMRSMMRQEIVGLR
jgi:F-type H+-transporting ATPase subunit epsilon